MYVRYTAARRCAMLGRGAGPRSLIAPIRTLPLELVDGQPAKFLAV
jgi:hypothetical protein